MAGTIVGVLSDFDPDAGTDEVPVVFDSPHSGAEYPDDFSCIAPMANVRTSEDAFVDELYAAAPKMGASLLAAHFPRAYIDADRSALDLDPNMLDGPWPEPLAPSPRTTQMGSGLVWTTCIPGIPMYDRKLSVAEVRRRIETCYKPYRAALAAALDDKRRRFGRVWHVNCHSMVSVSSVKGPEGRAGLERPHFILGDVDGSTCAPEFTDLVRATLAGLGYEVRIDDPYTAAELVIAHADPANGRHGLMIDIKRDLYMDEETIERTHRFAALKADITRLIEAICDYARSA